MAGGTNLGLGSKDPGKDVAANMQANLQILFPNNSTVPRLARGGGIPYAEKCQSSAEESLANNCVPKHVRLIGEDKDSESPNKIPRVKCVLFAIEFGSN